MAPAFTRLLTAKPLWLWLVALPPAFTVVLVFIVVFSCPSSRFLPLYLYMQQIDEKPVKKTAILWEGPSCVVLVPPPMMMMTSVTVDQEGSGLEEHGQPFWRPFHIRHPRHSVTGWNSTPVAQQRQLLADRAQVLGLQVHATPGHYGLP